MTAVRNDWGMNSPDIHVTCRHPARQHGASVEPAENASDAEKTPPPFPLDRPTDAPCQRAERHGRGRCQRAPPCAARRAGAMPENTASAGMHTWQPCWW